MVAVTYKTTTCYMVEMTDRTHKFILFNTIFLLNAICLEILLFILLVRDRMAVEFIATHIQSAPNVFELNMRSIQRYTDKVLGDLRVFSGYTALLITRIIY